MKITMQNMPAILEALKILECAHSVRHQFLDKVDSKLSASWYVKGEYYESPCMAEIDDMFGRRFIRLNHAKSRASLMEVGDIIHIMEDALLLISPWTISAEFNFIAKEYCIGQIEGSITHNPIEYQRFCEMIEELL